MTEDRSLDEFAHAGGGSDESDEVEEADEAGEAGEADEDERSDDTEENAERNETVAREENTEVKEDAEREETEIRDPDAVEPATATYDWSPDGAACEECETVVDRRWIDGDAYVCGDCKDW